MNWLDIVILVILIISIVLGVKAGIIKILFSVIGVIAGVVLAGRFSASLGGALTFISNPEWAKVAAFAIILIAVLVLAAVLAAVLSAVASAVLLGWVNRLGGGVLGLVVGSIFCAALLAMWAKYAGGKTVEGSAIARFFLDTFPVVLKLLPADFDSVREFFSK